MNCYQNTVFYLTGLQRREAEGVGSKRGKAQGDVCARRAAGGAVDYAAAINISNIIIVISPAVHYNNSTNSARAPVELQSKCFLRETTVKRHPHFKRTIATTAPITIEPFGADHDMAAVSRDNSSARCSHGVCGR